MKGANWYFIDSNIFQSLKSIYSLRIYQCFNRVKQKGFEKRGKGFKL